MRAGDTSCVAIACLWTGWPWRPRPGAVGEGQDRIEALRDLAVRADYVRRYANQALAESAPGEQIATVIDHEQSLALDLQEAVVTGATLQVYL